MTRLSAALPGAALLALVSALPPAPAFAWGPVAHRLVASRALETLPGPLKEFYKRHRLEIPTLSLEPPDEAETADRRFAIDHVAPFPFTDVPHAEAAFKARYPQAGEVGRLPWLIHEAYDRLVAAFKAGDKTKILEESDRLAGLVADLHNPLALTTNFDGQKTGQHGLWARLSVRLPEAMERRLKLGGDAAHYLDDPKEYVFSMVNASYVWADNVLYGEDLARRGRQGYTELYYETLEGRVGALVKDRLEHAAGDAGSYWYTAWTDAGKPDLK